MNKFYKQEQFHMRLILTFSLNLVTYLSSIVWYALFKNTILLHEWSILAALLTGLFQFIYIIPTIIWSAIKRDRAHTYGIIAGAFLTLAISTAVFIIISIYLIMLFSNSGF